MRTVPRASIVLVAAALVAAACGGGASGSGATAPVPSGGAVENGFVDPCAGTLPEGLLAVDTAAQLPVLGDDGTTGPLGVAGVEALVADLLDVDGGLCDLEVSPAVAASLAAAEEADAAGDRDEAVRILGELVASDLSAWTPAAPGILASGSTASHLQATRDWIAVAAEAALFGQDELADRAMDAARNEYAAYAWGDDDHPGAVETTNDPRELLEIAAPAALLGLDNIADDAIGKARSVLEQELRRLLEGFEPCTATEDQTEELLKTMAGYQLLGGDPGLGESTLQEIYDLARRRQAGEAVPECDALRLSASRPLTGFTGDVEIDLATCDGVTWTGMLAVEGSMDAEGASFTMTGLGDLAVTVDPATGRGEAPFTYTQDVRFVAGDATGSHRGEGTGTLRLAVDTVARTAEVSIEGDPWTATITVTAAGRSLTMQAPVEGFTAAFSTTLHPNESCG